jgi:hypothetical protein
MRVCEVNRTVRKYSVIYTPTKKDVQRIGAALSVRPPLSKAAHAMEDICTSLINSHDYNLFNYNA